MEELDLQKVINFYKLLNGFQRVVRVGHVPGEDRHENDVEHSYTLAMTAWYVIETFKLDLNVDKAIRYSLIHDLVEVYAGDVDAFTKNPELLEKKHEKEKEAMEKLAVEFPEALGIHTLIDQYETRNDPESVFVHALDKLMPFINQYVQDGRTIQSEGLSYSQVVTQKREKTSKSPEITKLLEQLISLVDKDKKRFFGDLTR
jgi:putative hydrolase of HD superfamily